MKVLKRRWRNAGHYAIMAPGPFYFLYTLCAMARGQEKFPAEILPIRCGKPQPGLSIFNSNHNLYYFTFILFYLCSGDIRRFSVGLWKGKADARQDVLKFIFNDRKIVIL